MTSTAAAPVKEFRIPLFIFYVDEFPIIETGKARADAEKGYRDDCLYIYIHYTCMYVFINPFAPRVRLH